MNYWSKLSAAGQSGLRAEACIQIPETDEGGGGRWDKVVTREAFGYAAADFVAGDFLGVWCFFPKDVSLEAHIMKAGQFAAAPLVIDGQKEDRIQGYVETEKIRQIDRQGNHGEVFFRNSRFCQDGPDHGVSFEIGQRVGLLGMAFGVGWLRSGQAGVGVGYTDYQVAAFGLGGQDIIKVVVVEYLEASVNYAGVVHINGFWPRMGGVCGL